MCPDFLLIILYWYLQHQAPVENKKKKTGINKQAQVSNVSEMRSALENIYPSLQKSKDKKKPEESQTEAAGKADLKKPISRKSKNGKGAPAYQEDDSTESESECVIRGKKIKLDPDFTPEKYEKVKQELDIQQNTVKRVLALNEKLRAHLKNSEASNSKLEGQVALLQSKLDQLQNEQSMLKKMTLLSHFVIFHYFANCIVFSFQEAHQRVNPTI